MFKTKMPICTEYEAKGADGSVKLIREAKEISVIIDTSIYSEERWESTFPTLASNETLNSYMTRIIARADSTSTAYLLSSLKVLYCFISSDELPTFRDFCQQFNMGSPKETEKLVGWLKETFNRIIDSSVSNPKN